MKENRNPTGRTHKRTLALLLAVVTLCLLLFSGCTNTNPAANNLLEDGTVNLETLSTEVKMDLFDYVKLPFSYLLRWLYDFTQNYGLALILFAVIVLIILFPTTVMSKKSMMKMSRLTPQVKALEAKYGDDKQKYQEEVNKLYKEEGTGGCSGCLWSLLPMLLLLPLYYIIREPITWLMFHGDVSPATIGQIQNVLVRASQSAAEGSALSKLDVTSFYWQLQALPFLGQLKDELAAISPNIVAMNTRLAGIELATIPHLMFWKYFDMNGVWNSIGQFLLPLLSGGVSWASMLISQKMNNSVITDKNGEYDENMAKQSNQTNQMMNLMMPLMSVYIGFVAPAGLSIYWGVQGIIRTIQDYFLTKHFKKVYDEEDRIKQERKAKEDALEAERERIRAEKRAQNPEGITANTSKKRLEQKQRQEQAAKEAAYQAKLREKNGESAAVDPADQTRPYRRGRAYRADRYDENNEE